MPAPAIVRRDTEELARSTDKKANTQLSIAAIRSRLSVTMDDHTADFAPMYCRPYYTVEIEIVSTRSLLKTGIFRARAGDFREILA
jgi:hypothetical protein